MDVELCLYSARRCFDRGATLFPNRAVTVGEFFALCRPGSRKYSIVAQIARTGNACVGLSANPRHRFKLEAGYQLDQVTLFNYIES